MTVQTLTRPNGKTYRPRKPGLHVQPWEDDDAGQGWNRDAGVIIFGTLDIDEATSLAKDAVKRYFDCDDVSDAYAAWFRNSFHGGQRVWVVDIERGRPGVCFKAVWA